MALMTVKTQQIRPGDYLVQGQFKMFVEDVESSERMGKPMITVRNETATLFLDYNEVVTVERFF